MRGGRSNPNTNLYDKVNPTWHHYWQEQSTYSGISIYDIEWVGGGDDSMRVKIHYAGSAEPADADTLDFSMNWDGLVQIMGDIVVDEGDTLTIEQGSTVVCAAEQDHRSGGEADSLAEIIVNGTLIVDGESGDEVSLISSRDNDFTHWCITGNCDGEDKGPSAGDWVGIRFEKTDDAEECQISYAAISHALFAVQVDSLTGNLFHPSFEGNGADIYLDRDTRIVSGDSWLLDAPTTVVADTVDFNMMGEDTSRIEIVVHGKLRTEDPESASERVVFTSNKLDPVNAGGWYGVTVAWNGVGDIADAEFTHSVNPLSFFAADTAIVETSYFHHYQETAITDWASQATIYGNTIDRGVGLSSASGYGQNGIYLSTSYGAVDSNYVFYQLENGIYAEGAGQTACEASPTQASAATLEITRNTIVGDQEEDNDSCNGLFVKWVCHQFDVEVERNNIQGWPGKGVRISNSSDAVISCNCIKGNATGAYHFRRYLDMDANNGDNLAEENNMEASENYNVQNGRGASAGGGAVEAGIIWGDTATAATGLNRLERDTQLAKNFYLSGLDSNRTDLAHLNAWFDSASVILTTEATIDATIKLRVPAWMDVEVDGFVTDTDSANSICSYGPTNCPAPPSPPSGAARLAGGPRKASVDERTRGEDGEEDGLLSVDLPHEFALALPRPNPSRGPVGIRLDVPWWNRDAVELKIFGVTGRRIRTLVSGTIPPGRHEVPWDRRDEFGRRVAAGVYFSHLRAGEHSATTKLVLLR